ncbi:hypothetical protein ACROYT_G030836 [Oculina patagonica]
MLKKADLGNKGFTKEVTVTNKLAEDSQNDTTETTYFFYKSVNCTYKAMREVEKELNSSLPGFIENDMPSKMREEVKYRHLNNAGLCKMGVKVGFEDSVGCELRRRKRGQRRPRGIRIRIKIRINIKITINKRR